MIIMLNEFIFLKKKRKGTKAYDSTLNGKGIMQFQQIIGSGIVLFGFRPTPPHLCGSWRHFKKPEVNRKLYSEYTHIIHICTYIWWQHIKVINAFTAQQQMNLFKIKNISFFVCILHFVPSSRLLSSASATQNHQFISSLSFFFSRCATVEHFHNKLCAIALFTCNVHVQHYLS